MTVKVLLATTVKWPSAGRLAGAFAAAGCTVDGLLPAGHPAAQSRYFSKRYDYRPLTGVSSLLETIAASHPALIVALDDRATALLLRAHDRATSEIAALITHSLGAIQNYKSLMSRSGFIDAARQADIRTPKTFAVASEEELQSALAQTGFPAVIKADGTWGGDGVIFARNREEAAAAYHKLGDPPSRLRSIVRAIRRSDVHFLHAALDAQPSSISVQQFIAGKPVTTSFSCWQGKLLSANHLEAVVTQGVTAPASVLQPIENPDMQAAAERLAAHFHLSGLHGLDYIRDESGKSHLIEINPRATQSSYLSFGTGHDLVSALVARVSGQPRPPRPRVAESTVALFPQEWMRDPASPWLKSAFHDVPWDDPALIRAWMASDLARPTLHKWESFMAGEAQAAAAKSV